jgi:hypothetical protein
METIGRTTGGMYSGWKMKARGGVVIVQPRGCRQPEGHEILLDQEGGLNWERLCRSYVLFLTPNSELIHMRMEEPFAVEIY